MPPIGSRRFDPLDPGGEAAPERDAAPPRVAEALGRAIRTGGWQERLRGARVHLQWREIAGPQLARQAQPVRLRGGVLVVRVESPVWATEVRYLSGELVARANVVLGAGEVQRISVVTGPAPRPEAQS